jgi:hypothetical protein
MFNFFRFGLGYWARGEFRKKAPQVVHVDHISSIKVYSGPGIFATQTGFYSHSSLVPVPPAISHYNVFIANDLQILFSPIFGGPLVL